jgi:hypothetical protein
MAALREEVPKSSARRVIAKKRFQNEEGNHG